LELREGNTSCEKTKRRSSGGAGRERGATGRTERLLSAETSGESSDNVTFGKTLLEALHDTMKGGELHSEREEHVGGRGKRKRDAHPSGHMDIGRILN